MSAVIAPANVRADAACPTSAPESSVNSPQHLVTGPIENGKEYLYVTETKAHQIARISRRSNSKVFLEARYETDEQVSSPHRIVLGPDELDLTRSLWWTETDSDTIGQMTFPTHGMVSHGATIVEDGPTGITLGPDDLVWFTTNDPATSAGWLGTSIQIPRTRSPRPRTERARSTSSPGHTSPGPDPEYMWYAISIPSKIRGINVDDPGDRPGPYDGVPPLNYPKALALG